VQTQRKAGTVQPEGLLHTCALSQSMEP